MKFLGSSSAAIAQSQIGATDVAEKKLRKSREDPQLKQIVQNEIRPENTPITATATGPVVTVAEKDAAVDE